MAKQHEISTAVGVDLTRALAHGSSGIRKKMRDINRLLQRENIPADMKIANERALKTLELELEKTQEDQLERKMAVKYHKVRFFEKKKAKRFYLGNKKKVENLEEKINNTKEEEELKKLKKELRKVRRLLEHSSIDLAYVLNFPKIEKYISLYPNIDESKIQKNEKYLAGVKQANKKREEYKKMFADQLKKGELGISIETEFEGDDDDKADSESKKVYNNKNNKNSNNKNNKNTNNRKPNKNIDDVEQNNKDKQEEDDFFE
ncbi:18S rRNA maturation protein [Pichia californica]|uniref:rRNA-processing protein EFG1 n=1 Tax=Pichia californica TaxID=460514 RepID=A0A9P6WKU4_9ASCO|nr:18S rRNA maturation protein [[Candida] californica]